MLRLKSLVFLSTNKSAFLDCLIRSGLRTPEGRAWAGPATNTALEALRRDDLLDVDHTCPPALLHPVAIDAVASPEGERMVAAVRRAFPSLVSGQHYARRQETNPEPLIRLARLAVYANDEDGFIAERDRHDSALAPQRLTTALGALLAPAPFAPDWIDSRAPAIQAGLFEGRIAALLSGHLAIPGLAELIARYRKLQDGPGFAPVRRALLAHDVLALRLDAAGEALAKLDAADAPLRLAAEATLRFLAGQNARAIGLYRAALKELRKQAGKRKLFLDGAHGLFFLMALLRANDATLHAEIQAGIDVLPLDQRPHPAGWLGLQMLLWLAQGLEGKARELLDRLKDFSTADWTADACLALAEHAIDPDRARRREAQLAASFAAVKDRLALPARIYAEILADVADKPAHYTAFLQATGAGIGVAFTNLIQVTPPWERALDGLDAFLFAGGRQAGGEQAPRKTKRLAWFLDPATLHIEVAEQSAKGRDGWSDGRAVAMKRLYEQDPRLDYLTAEDRRALRGIRREKSGWYHDDYNYRFDPVRVLPALVSHAAVFDARSRLQPIDLVAYPVELVVTDQGKGYRIALSHTADRSSVFLEAETPNRYRVIELTERLLTVQQILGSKGLSVPKNARERVIGLVQRANPSLPIRAEIDAVEATARDGIAIPVVQLAPQGDPAQEGGVKITLLVRPFGPEGPTYVAGLGGRSVLASMGGQQVRARRDLEAELAARHALVEACPTLLACGAGQAYEVVVDGLERCLDLLLELQALAGEVVLEWPQGRKLSVGAVSPPQLRFKVRQVRDWFAVEGSVAVGEDEVLEMRFLLERLDRAQGRFVPLDDGRFVALTQRLQAQLRQLAAVSDPDKTGQRVHAFAAAAVDDLLDEAGKVEADAAWRKHVARLREAGTWIPKIPGTLQAELRDYQGRASLAGPAGALGRGRLPGRRHGPGQDGAGAGADAAPRAPRGRALVVAPTSVCSELGGGGRCASRPTLTVHRSAARATGRRWWRGWGRRDVLLCSYGLLHQEADAARRAALADGGAGRGAGDQERRDPPRAGDASPAGRVPAGADRHAGGEPPGRAVEPVPLHQPGLLGSREKFQQALRRPDRARPRPGGALGAAALLRRSSCAAPRRRC